MKKGFTLVELLAVIVILAVILAIAVPSISGIIDSAKNSAFESNEKMLKSAAKNYIASNTNYIPTSASNMTLIKLSDLQSNNYISTITSPKNKATICDGYVAIKYIDNSLKYEPYLKCGSDYTTSGYVSTSLSSLEVLVVAGGGAGGSHKITSTSTSAGGGGAGGLIYNSSYAVTPLSSISITVGDGGISPLIEGAGGNGGNTNFGTLTAVGGGGGGNRWFTPTDGGSGGGRGYATIAGGLGIAGQGNNGGSGVNGQYGGAGGGGASSAGVQATGAFGTDGGAGMYYGNLFGNSFGAAGYFAGGGGGGGSSAAGGLGGTGGAGNGGSTSAGGNALANTGSGGGGASTGGYIGGNGGSGIVLIRYTGPQKASGGTVTEYNGYTIHAFTDVGASVFKILSF